MQRSGQEDPQEQEGQDLLHLLRLVADLLPFCFHDRIQGLQVAADPLRPRDPEVSALPLPGQSAFPRPAADPACHPPQRSQDRRVSGIGRQFLPAGQHCQQDKTA